MIAKYKIAVEAKERELAELKEALTSLQKAMRIMEREGLFQENLPMPETTPERETDEFAGKGLRESLLAIIEAAKGEGITSRDIYHKLMAGGYTSASKDKLQDVMVGVSRLKDRVTYTQKGRQKGRMRYYSIRE
ncbi:MAG: hypothetical protein Q8J64_04850 [Thermodesulfovibrionales bacterium]|nr:hypothetical protein [Thermodesulfovibrionales bacterium]